jgi:putative transposase
MSRRVYSEINLHIIWHTKDNLRFIDDRIEPLLYKYLQDRIVETNGAYFHAIGGIDTHVHIAVSVKPTIGLDNWIGQLKGASSHEFGKALQWQSGYGIVSFGSKDLKWVVDYVLNQKEHHRRGTVYDRLERIEDEKSNC